LFFPGRPGMNSSRPTGMLSRSWACLRSGCEWSREEEVGAAVQRYVRVYDYGAVLCMYYPWLICVCMHQVCVDFKCVYVYIECVCTSSW
jgi:hypothetical protein